MRGILHTGRRSKILRKHIGKVCRVPSLQTSSLPEIFGTGVLVDSGSVHENRFLIQRQIFLGVNEISQTCLVLVIYWWEVHFAKVGNFTFFENVSFLWL